MSKEIITKEKNEIQINNNVNIEGLLQSAVDKNLPVETMEKLLTMRTQLKQEMAREQYYIALSDFQMECPIIKKTKEVKYVSRKTGKTTSYYYAPLDEIIKEVKELLQKHGFSYNVITEQANNSVTAICNTYHIAGHSEKSGFNIPVDPEAFMNAQQKIASALTYAKRYAFCNAFGILTGDDDDDAMQGNEPENEKKVFQSIKEKAYEINAKVKADPNINPELGLTDIDDKTPGFEDIEIIGENGSTPWNEHAANVEIRRIATELKPKMGKADIDYFTKLFNSKDKYTQDQYLFDMDYLSKIETGEAKTLFNQQNKKPLPKGVA